ncbi:8299_t:CDS:2 [Ambispora gerdemannii]|uniref:8299_t:CDS:1 n=1 Tax=Ambispora gerdemannii TaxID=144530 RepID=A0A9N9FJN3_9GLOM|nr:8299_t:CDS:2 [Ambispora gerdemannii]
MSQYGTGNNQKNFSFSNFGGLKRSNSLSHDDLFDLLEWVGIRSRWTNYVYLLLIVWDSDKRSDFRGGHKFGQEYDKVTEHLRELYTTDGATQNQFNLAMNSLEKFAKFFRNHEEDLRKPTLEYAYSQIGLTSADSYNEGALLREQLHRLSSDQRARIRHLLIRRIQSFAIFSGHVQRCALERQQLPNDNENISNETNDHSGSVAVTTTPTRISSNDHDEVTDLKNQILELQKKNKKLTELLSQSDEKVDVLQDQAARYKEEASNYQAALGNAINVRWRDDDPNNAVNMGDDIEKLVHLLGSFTKVKGSGVRIREDAASQLLASYKCKTEITDKRDAQEWIDAEEEWVSGSGFLVQEPSELALNQSYDSNYHNNLEVDIISITKDLIRLMTRFSEVRTGSDNFTPIAPIKLRQHVYAALGSRAFNDVTHPFIRHLAEKIISIMDFYRELVDEQKKQELSKEASDLILEVIHLFFFRLKAQPIVPEFQFFSAGCALDSELMEGTWENVQKSEVEICYFPVIGVNLGSKDRRVFTKARVIARPKSAFDDEGDD